MDQELIDIALSNRDNNGVGVFQGWGKINRGELHQYVFNDYDNIKIMLMKHGVLLIRWYWLTFDADDYNIFGVKML